MKTTIQKIDEIVDAQHKEVFRKVLEPYIEKPKEDILWGSEKLHEAINNNIQQFIKPKDPSLPRGNNFTPKKKKRK